MKGLMGKKMGMTQIWTNEGKMVPVTVVKAEPSYVVQIKTQDKDGYSAFQLGYGITEENDLNLSLKGHQKKLNDSASVHVSGFYEVRDYPENLQIGQQVGVSIFEAGQKISVRSISKGKGFQGVVKRYGFHGGRMTHGSRFHRTTGSVGAGTTPGNVIKGKKMPGKMGNEWTTVKNIEIIKIDPENKIMLLKGSIPGPQGREVFLYVK